MFSSVKARLTTLASGLAESDIVNSGRRGISSRVVRFDACVRPGLRRASGQVQVGPSGKPPTINQRAMWRWWQWSAKCARRQTCRTPIGCHCRPAAQP